MPGGGEDAHVAAGFGDDHISGRDRDPEDGGDQLPGGTKRDHQLLDPVGECGDRRGVLVDQGGVDLDQEGVVMGEPAR
ncbi:MAG: hypothetical protein V9G19_21385 [Tetrasphaera sp.]